MNDRDAKRRSQQVWGATPAGSAHGSGRKIGTSEFFDRVYRHRRFEEVPFLDEVFPFDSTKGSRVLEIGCGAGFDAYTFVRSGANYVGIDLTPENPARARQHLGLHGLDAAFAVADAEQLPFDDGAFDACYSLGVLHHTPNISRALAEAYRVLRPQGELWLGLYHRDSLFYWVTLFLVEHLILGGFRHRTFRERLAMIEQTEADVLPHVTVYSRREVRLLLRAVGFEAIEIVVRKLSTEDLPTRPIFIGQLLRAIPAGWLTRLAPFFGWYVVVRARKPIGRAAAFAGSR